jgi:hypothetical protein
VRGETNAKLPGGAAETATTEKIKNPGVNAPGFFIELDFC